MGTRHEEAIEKIRAYLLERQPAADERLPSEREFERLLGVNRSALNKAIACLIAEGVVCRDGYKLSVAGAAPAEPGAPPVHVLSPRSQMHARYGPLTATHDVARERATHTIPVLTDSHDDEREALARLLNETVNGFVLWPHGPDCNVDLLTLFHEKGVPFVLCDMDAGDFDFVGTDNEAGVELAVRHLTEHGHRDIVYITQTQAYRSLLHRCAGFREACLLFDLKESSGQIIEIPDVSDRHCAAAFSAMRQQYPTATAFVVGNDTVALGMFRAASAAGVRVPEDLSAVGFDDDEAACLSTPPLTTIHQDFYEIGYLATQLLFQRLTRTPHRDPEQPVRLGLQPRLVIRGSVAQPQR